MKSEGETLDHELLRTLCSLPGVSGQETAVTDEIGRRLGEVADAVHRDAIGNLHASVGGSGRPHVALVAHADQIGYIVTDADERGFLSLERVGEAFGDLLPGRELVVHTANGPLHGVVGRTPMDLLPKKRRGKVAEVRDHWLDIGARSREEALSAVRVGDPVTFVPRFLELRNGLLASPCLDDRAGLYVVLRALEQWAALRPRRDATDPEGIRVTAVATAREETGFLGARTLAQALDCDVAIVRRRHLRQRRSRGVAEARRRSRGTRRRTGDRSRDGQCGAPRRARRGRGQGKGHRTPAEGGWQEWPAPMRTTF